MHLAKRYHVAREKREDHIMWLSSYRGINSRHSDFDPGLAWASLVDHGRMTPSPQGVYEGAGDPSKSVVLPQAKRPSLGNLNQERSNTLIGRTPAGKNTLLETPQYQEASLSPRSLLLLCTGGHSPPESSLSLFLITDSSGEIVSSKSPPWLPGVPCCCRFSSIFR